jgi:hypothetical protein
MPDFKKMTVERLRELARKVLGPGHSRLKTKGDLIRALEEAEAPPARPEPRARVAASSRAAAAGGKAVAAGGKAVRAAKAAAKDAGSAAREGARRVARAGKVAAGAAAEGAKAGTKVVRERKGGKVAKAAAAAAGAVAGVVAAAKRARVAAAQTGPDPEGYFVARVRGEAAVRDAPHPMSESGSDAPQRFQEGVGAPAYDEELGELPPGYGDDAFVALPRDPRTLFVYWDLSHDTAARGFEGLEGARAQLWVFARAAAGWDRLRTVDFALESHGYYVHDLEPGRTYRAEIHALDRRGGDRLVGRPSNEVTLPPVGPSPVLDDRFIRIPWEMPLGRLLGPGHAGGPFSDEARALLARLSDWSRFAGRTWGGSGGGKGAPSSPTSPSSSPSGRDGEE